MFKDLYNDGTETQVDNDWDESELLCRKDLSNPEHIDVKKASLELTTESPLHDRLSPVDDDAVPEEEELTRQEWYKVIKRLKEFGVEKVTITGGDPTMRGSDFRPILQTAIRTFDSVTVQVTGVTNQALSDFDCTVSIPFDYIIQNDYNNNLRRMTDPDKFYYDTDRKKMFEIVEKEDKLSLQQTDKEYSEEMATGLAFDKAFRIDNPVVIRSHILNSNNIQTLIALAQMLGADVVFRPMYPVDVEPRLLEQIPAPGRMYDVMETVSQLNALTNQNTYTIKSPMYKAWSQEKAIEEGTIPPYRGDEMMEWFARGRVQEIGVSSIHVAADGTVMPSRYIRQDKYNCGNILLIEQEKTLNTKLASFNEKVTIPDDHSPSTTFDVEQRSLITDYNMVLNTEY